ncbi:pre-peptidase C-terminal domain-containing protein [Nitrosococcus wardiae]|uniref:Uncharacterized protein n=1 Tax=Nitrosococcus wardiae TaxID=1814290 RepID=A0A4P7C118_9GAMM|nr:pre-peptidase C-terminal domain-containing protein [Nitrosococcus wardiae]QBQ56071.1 hypothetical protein E3U44_17300 [Nitrosococcus wardiae]
MPGDSDFFTFEVPNPHARVTVSTIGETNTTGRLFKLNESDGRFTYQNIRDFHSGFDLNFLISKALEKGTYCVEVTGHNNDDVGDYLFQTTGAFIPAGSCSGEAVSLSATSLDFGAVPQRNVRRKLIILENTGEEPLFIDSVTLAGTNPAQFGIVNDTCSGHILQPAQLKGRKRCSLRPAFAPLGPVGLKTANLLISCNAPDSLPLKVKLKGHGFIRQ